MSGNKILRMIEGKNNAEINNTSKKVKNNIINKNGIFYIPISEVTSVYNLEVEEYENKTINLDCLNKQKVVASVSKKTKLKYKPTFFSTTLKDLKQNERITIVEKNKKYTKVKTSDGNIGYIKTKFVKNEKVEREEFALNQKIKTDDDDNVSILADEDVENGIDSITKNYDTRKEFISKIVETAIKNKLKGVKVDFKNIENKDNFYKFLTELRPYLNEYSISLIVEKDNNLDTEKLKNIVNEIK